MKQLKIYPAEQRLVILPDEKALVSKGGIILPPGAEQSLPEFGTVIAAGSGSSDRPMEYKVGRKVLYSEYAGTEVKLNLTGEILAYKIMNQADVMAVIYEDNENL